MSADVARVLDDAAGLLERDGWCQRLEVNAAGAHCAVGAIWAAGDFVGASVAIPPFQRWLGDRSITLWNDDHGRTAEEVIATLRAAAEAERGAS